MRTVAQTTFTLYRGGEVFLLLSLLFKSCWTPKTGLKIKAAFSFKLQSQCSDLDLSILWWHHVYAWMCVYVYACILVLYTCVHVMHEYSYMHVCSMFVSVCVLWWICVCACIYLVCAKHIKRGYLKDAIYTVLLKWSKYSSFIICR